MSNQSTTTQSAMKAAVEATALIKSTAETTAMALNIQYMQRDISEIKQGQKENATKLEQALQEINLKDEQYIKKEQFNDHETRLRSAEVNITKILTWGSIAIVVLGIAEFMLNQYLSK